MEGVPKQWPNWPEFTKENGETGDDLTEYKRAIIAKYGEESLVKSWNRVCKELESITENIACAGSEAIPEVRFDDLFTVGPEKKQELKTAGCFVVRDVFSQKQADKWFDDLKAYIAKNKSSIRGWPKETPFILNLYFSPTQMAARSHPNQLKLSRELNSWWTDSTGKSSPDPLSYADGVRIRPPGVPFYGLGPHIDAGSLSRWTDPAYQAAYSAVFSGQPDLLDSYDLSLRQDAKAAMFDGSSHSRVLRSFQGWTALTGAGPGEGSLMLYPNVKWTIAYVLLRPFFKAPESEKDIMDASKWAFDAATPWFPGTWKDDSQLVSPTSHPHLRMYECMVPIPRMNAGDAIFWHADMIHAVEVEHNGHHETSVAYIAATPSTEENKRYIQGQLKNFLQGIPPEDFRGGSCEKSFDGFPGEEGILSGEEGRRAMGFDLLGAA